MLDAIFKFLVIWGCFYLIVKAIELCLGFLSWVVDVVLDCCSIIKIKVKQINKFFVGKYSRKSSRSNAYISCPTCGSKIPEEAAGCIICAANEWAKQQAYEARTASREYKEQEGYDKQKKTSRGTHSSDNSYQIVSCPECRKKIRVKMPLSFSRGRCTACLAEFSVYMDDGVVRVYKSTHKEQRHSENKKTSETKKEDPLASCYKTLGVDSSASPSYIRDAYRKKIRQYHPDKVANLGEKLQELANEESKNINDAYAVLKAEGKAL